ncbi:MAG: biopolymer transporter ExbD [Myxococcota bacterium]
MSTEHDDQPMMGSETPVGAGWSEEAPVDPIAEAYGRGPGRRKRRVRRTMPGQTIGHLNLTPMMDIMTMLLVFLVKSFAQEPDNININLVRPPESSTKVMMEAATKVVVTRDEILVDDQPIIGLAAVNAAEGGQASIPQLRDALLERADHLKALENRGGTPFDGRLLVVADETTPYSVITSVLLTAGESRFSEYKLVVMQKAAQ